MPPVNIFQIVTYSNRGVHVITASYTNKNGISKTFTLRPGESTSLFVIEEEESLRKSDFSLNCLYTITLRRGHCRKDVTYPPADVREVDGAAREVDSAVREVDVNKLFDEPVFLTFINKDDDNIFVSYTNSSGKTSSFCIGPHSQEKANNIASTGGAHSVTLQRGTTTICKDYTARNSPIDVNAAFPGPVYRPINNGRDTVDLVYNNDKGVLHYRSVPQNNTDAHKISLNEGPHTVQRGGVTKYFVLSLVMQLARDGTIDVNQLYNQASHENNAHVNCVCTEN
ncbi:hypothetical protein DFH11DRAFT_1734970 [Phellopilus nigrolimitatus]|nr:hypothetical protein DFH11DRAFT_1734970 [Phellopilus nigrolimitatus]